MLTSTTDHPLNNIQAARVAAHSPCAAPVAACSSSVIRALWLTAAVFTRVDTAISAACSIKCIEALRPCGTDYNSSHVILGPCLSACADKLVACQGATISQVSS